VITDAQFIAWLSQEHADRVILYEQDYMYEDTAGEPALGTLYLSDKPYAPVGSQPYVDSISAVPEFERSLGGNRLSTYSSSIGAVEIINTDGELDFLLDLAIDGSEARFYFGDASWERADFRLIFTVRGMRVSRAPFTRLTIDLKDSTSLLNQSVGGTQQVGGSGPYANNARPLNVGFIHNLTPLVLDSINLTYVHSDSIYAEAVEVRDDGVPVTFVDNGDGTLELNAAPAGLITCDVYSVTGVDQDKLSDAMSRLVGARGGFAAAGLYYGPHATFVEDDNDDYRIGMSIQDARNVIDVLDELTESGNCFTAIRRDGQFTFGRLRPYDIEGLGTSAGLEPVDIVEDDIIPQTAFDVQHLTPEYYQYQAYAHKNWTVQNTLSELLQPDEQARFTRKGQYALQTLVGGTTYALAPELYHKTLSTSPPIETLLSWEDDSSIVDLTQWMETRRAMFLPWLEIVTVTVPLGANPDAPAMFYALELGDVVRVTVPRFGYDAGVLFQVIAIGIGLSKARTMLRLVRKRGVSAPPIGWESGEQYIIQTPLAWRPGTPSVEIGPPVVVILPPPPVGPTLQEYFFDYYGGVFYGGAVSLIPEFYDADTNSPLWYEEVVEQSITVYGDEAANFVANVYIPFTTNNFSTGALHYPANISYVSEDVMPEIYFLDNSQQALPAPGSGAAIDYTANPYEVTGIVVAVPGTIPEFILSSVDLQGWFAYDTYNGANLTYFAATFVTGAGQLGSTGTVGVTYGHLLITVVNQSGSTITDIDADGIGTSITIGLPTTAVDPDDVQDSELDISFVGGSPSCAVHNAGSITLTVSGSRHSLSFKVEDASITDGQTVRFVFPIVAQIGEPTGYGTPASDPNTTFVNTLPVITGDDSVVTTPSTTVKFFNDMSTSLQFEPE